jgi:formylmethanofuran dehydrogenase subunit E
MNIQSLLEISSHDHSHLCPRQILGVRLGLCGLSALQLEPNHGTKRILIIAETDGCFVDGISASTDCTVGHRTLRIEDYGKAAATFVDTRTGLSYRIAPAHDIRERAYLYAGDESRHYFAQMRAYQIMPDHEMFTVRQVQLTVSHESLVSRPGVRVNCDVCGEEIMNERELVQDGMVWCRSCANGSYYRLPVPLVMQGTAAHSHV